MRGRAGAEPGAGVRDCTRCVGGRRAVRRSFRAPRCFTWNTSPVRHRRRRRLRRRIRSRDGEHVPRGTTTRPVGVRLCRAGALPYHSPSRTWAARRRAGKKTLLKSCASRRSSASSSSAAATPAPRPRSPARAWACRRCCSPTTSRRWARCRATRRSAASARATWSRKSTRWAGRWASPPTRPASSSGPSIPARGRRCGRPARRRTGCSTSRQSAPGSRTSPT